ncbi:MAG: NACHT domain-containing protein [Glomeribacter sp. 1016415]|nr:NACHT domain-containing protein [Glomeribacter sp. 1016415]
MTNANVSVANFKSNSVHTAHSRSVSQSNVLDEGRKALEEAIKHHDEAKNESDSDKMEISREKAKASLTEAQNLFDQVLTASTTSPKAKDIKIRLAESYVEIGDILCDLASFSSAKVNYENAKKISNKITVNRKLNSLPKFFTENPTPELDRKFRFEDQPAKIIDTEHLAYCLNRKTNLEESDKLLELAYDIVRLFSEEPRRSEIMREIAPLSKIANANFYRELISKTVEVFARSQLLMLPAVATGLAVMIQNCPEEANLCSTELLRILSNCLENGCKSGEKEHLLSLLQVTSQLLDAMVQSIIKKDRSIKISRDDLQVPLKKVLDELGKNGNEELAYQARYAYQALIHIPNDESRGAQAWRHAYNIGGGAVLIWSGVLALDPDKFLAAFDRLYEKERHSIRDGLRNVKEYLSKGKYREWYRALPAIDHLLEQNKLDQFEYFVRKSKLCRDSEFLQSLCQRLEKIAVTVSDIEIGKKAIDFLIDIVHDPILWGKSKPVAQSVANALQRLKKQPQLQTYIVDSIKKKGVKLPESAISYDKLSIWDPIWRKAPTNNLLSKAQPDFDPDTDCLRDEILTPKVEKMLEERYVKQAIRNVCLDTTINVDTAINDFINSEHKKVLLLLGITGSGKSTFNQYLAQYLWNLNTNDRWTPIYISLPSRENPNQNLITRYLNDRSFKEKHIIKWKQKRLIFILDSYDGVAHQSGTLFADRTLEQWSNSKIIITSRPLNQERYQKKFHPYGKEEVLQENQLNLFSSENIREYTQKYLGCLNQNGAMWTAQTYEDKLRNAPDIVKLLEHPLLLEQALEAWPKSKERKVELYDKLVDKWYEHVSDILDQAISVDPEFAKFNPNKSFKISAIQFNKEFAVAIHEDAYPVQTGQQAKKYADFLNNTENKPQLLFSNAPLIYQNGEYQFIHISLRDYFVARALWEPEPDPKPKHWERDEKTEVTWLNSLKLDKTPLVIDFLVERIKKAPDLEQRLRRLLQDPNQPIAAENAQTILTKAGLSISIDDNSISQIPTGEVVKRKASDYGKFKLVLQVSIASIGLWAMSAAWQAAAQHYKTPN